MAGFGGYIEGGTGGGGGGSAAAAGQLIETVFMTSEPISGGRCVSFNTSGTVQIAQCMFSGRMPAIGYVRDNYASGVAATIYRAGRLFNNVSGVPFNYSGFIGYPLFVGLSGEANASGAPDFSGAIVQTVGVSIYESGILLQIGNAFEEYYIVSGDIGSGTVNNFQFGSGATAPAAQAVSPFLSGFYLSGQGGLISEETISGVRAVQISPTGGLRMAMAGVSGRMPAIGVCFANVLSGIQVGVFTQGMSQTTSGLQDFSGYVGKSLWVGRSGHLATVSGSWASGGWLSGDLGQMVGTVVNSGGVLINLRPTVLSGGPDVSMGIL